ncbi:ExeM/NucH family extracellular endonuclease [Spongiimicrobium salis]|uniref:ExeM/NucH family extracellular endonuclease n=1 Tax=Spongiimicrobium salis TaxID=1667022 RepID=UPI00374CAF4B
MIKKITLLLVTALASFATLTAQTVLLGESFETDGNGTRYTTSIPEFSDGFGDFFTRTDGSNIGAFYEVFGADGNFYFVAQDIDGEGSAAQQTLTFSGIDISNFENLNFSALFAEDDDAANQDWDDSDFLRVEYQIDGGGFQNLLAIEEIDNGTAFNQEPGIDTDFDGVADGAAITSTFTAFGNVIAGTGSSLDIRITISLNSGDEDIAIDRIEVTGDAVVNTPTGLVENFDNDEQFDITAGAFFTDGAGDYFTITDGSTIGSFVDLSGFEGSFLAAQDLDGEGGPATVQLTWSGINIEGLSTIAFRGLFAEDDDGTNQDWDADSSVLLEYSIDGAAFQNVIAFAAAGGTNTEPLEDTDFDGIGDGLALTAVAQEFTKTLIGTGSALVLRLTISGLDAGDEDIAIDALVIEEEEVVNRPLGLVENFDNEDQFDITAGSFFTDTFGDYFTITDGSNIGSFVELKGFDGPFLAAQDLDGEGGPTTVQLTWSNINIEGIESIAFKGLFAEDDDAANQDWDADSSVLLEYSIDGGAFQNLIAFAAAGGTNTEPLEDTDFDGIGDGLALTNVAQEFMKIIPETGSNLILRLTIAGLDAGDEDIAIDALRIMEDVPVAPLGLFEPFDTEDQFAITAGAFFTDGAGDYFTITDGSTIGSFAEFTGFEGSFLAAQDLDGEGGPTTVQLTWSDINIEGLQDIAFSGLFAEDDSSDGNEDWDDNSSVRIEYAIDGGAFQNLLAFEAAGGTNTEPLEDTDFDGIGDGIALTPTAQEFTKNIAATGATISLRLTISGLDAGDEDIAMDAFRIGAALGGNDITLAISPENASRSEGNEGITDFTFTVTRGGDTSGTTAVDYVVSGSVDANDFGGTLPSGTVEFVADETSQTITLGVSGDLEEETNESFTVTLSNPTNDAILLTATAEGTIQDDDTELAITLIHDIQGSGPTVAITQEISVEAIVVGDFQNDDQLDGFYVQEEDADADADAATSEGIFVFCGSNNCGSFTDINVGDRVQVTGTPAEFGGQSQIVMTGLRLIDSDNVLPTPAILDLPVTALTDLESFEGMLISSADALYVTEHFDLTRFGSVVLTSQLDRLFQPTAVAAPGAAANALAQANSLDRIILDDGRTGRDPEPLVFPSNFSALNSLRGGDSLPAGFTGVLGEGFDEYRIQPVGEVNFTASNPRTVTPEEVGGNLKVTSFNVLNFFTTLNQRGAESELEFDRQRDKIIAAISAIGADIVGLIELENNATASLQSLIDGLNALDGTNTWSFVDAGIIGGDQIKVGIIYKTAVVEESGTFAILDASVDPRFIDNQNRPVLAQTFTVIDSNNPDLGERLTVAITHLKSKGSDCNALGDPDTGDGQGNCNITRTTAAQAMVDWFATNPTGTEDNDLIVLGDFNAYQMEDPITAMRAGADDTEGTEDDYVQLEGSDSYSFVFRGQWGSLDNAFANSSLAGQITGSTVWHINADEPVALDYNVNGQSPAQIELFYNADPYRASDHDPIVVGLDLNNNTVEPRAVTSFVLVNADTDEDIMEITEGMVIDQLSLPTQNLNFRVETSGIVESVRFEVSGAFNSSRTENVAPYALLGDFPAGDFNGRDFALGTYTLFAIPFAEDGLQGDAGTDLTINFEFIEQRPSIISFTLVDAETDEDILQLEEGMQINIADLPTDFLNIRANASEDTQSVRLQLSGAVSTVRTENVIPYAVFGDVAPDYFGRTLGVGSYNISAVAFSEPARGGLSGSNFTIDFDIVETIPPSNAIAPYAVSLYPNAATTNVNLTVSDREVDIVKIQIFDLQGRKIAEYAPAEVRNADGYRLPVYQMQGGMYIVNTVDSEGKMSQRRLLVDKR